MTIEVTQHDIDGSALARKELGYIFNSTKYNPVSLAISRSTKVPFIHLYYDGTVADRMDRNIFQVALTTSRKFMNWVDGLPMKPFRFRLFKP